ncbi:acetyl-coenzyme A synthetase N-terminal domain-containing protein [Nonomuraea rubra]|uniref:acetyl-coenzyme A synthetase N-terminal domain-containing protein n=1 Tax=Nonomuraea rubra TaxID=46180 RepID=UPI0036063A78
MSGFDEVYRRSIEQPERFWGEAARGIDWDVPPRPCTARAAGSPTAGSTPATTPWTGTSSRAAASSPR